MRRIMDYNASISVHLSIIYNSIYQNLKPITTVTLPILTQRPPMNRGDMEY